MPKRIVVLLDGSQFAEDALATALTLVPEDGSIDLVTAVEGAPPFSVPDYDVMAREWAARYLEGVVDKLPPAVTAQPHVLVGPPGSEVRGFVEESRADLVVLATHGRGPFSRAWLGSMADLLVRTSPVPLLLVHPAGETPSYQAGDPITKVLVPLDGSELSERAAVEAPGLLGEGVARTLLKVVQYPYHYASPYLPDTIQGNQDLYKQATEGAKAYMAEVAQRLGGDAPVETDVVTAEAVAKAIVEYAESHGCDAIAIGTHGRGGFSRLALGSVADKVIRTARVPVLTLRAAEVPAEASEPLSGPAVASISFSH